jgi:hypothetical protein
MDREERIKALLKERTAIQKELNTLRDQRAVDECPFKVGDELKQKGVRDKWTVVRVFHHPIMTYGVELTIGGKGSINRYSHQMEDFRLA